MITFSVNWWVLRGSLQTKDKMKYFELVAEDMAAVYRLVQGHLSSNVQIVSLMGRHMGRNSGKMLRPALMLLVCRMLDGDSDRVRRLAAVVELIHTATLIHDDIIDGAGLRRGYPTLNAGFGNEMSVLMGDWFYITAFQTALGLNDFRILEVLLETVQRMVEGELIQLEWIGRRDITLEKSIEIATRKTAILFAACTQLAGIACGEGADTNDALRRLGLDLGLAFQVVDDVLDFTSVEETLGKPIMNDLREGKVTLPIIYLLQDGSPEHGTMVDAVLAERDFISVTPDRLKRVLVSTGTLEKSMAAARSYASAASSALLTFPDSIYRNALEQIPDFIISRRY